MAHRSGPPDVRPDQHPLDLASRERTYRWEDPAIPGDAARTLAGTDFLRAIADGTLPPPPLATTLGFSIVDIEPGRAVWRPHGPGPGQPHRQRRQALRVRDQQLPDLPPVTHSSLTSMIWAHEAQISRLRSGDCCNA
jgi:hypothetical protein